MTPARLIQHRRRASRQRGMNIIELMVGLTVGMLLVAGLALMFGNATRSTIELDKTVRHIENGRHAMDLLSQDIALAGYYGTVPVTTSAAGLSPCATSAQVATDLATQAALAFPTVPFGLEGLSADQVAGYACLPNHKADTPALILRRLDTTAVAPAAVTADAAYVQTSHNTADNFYTYRAAANGSGFTLRNLAGGINPVRRFMTRAYYIASCGNCAGGGDGIPTLKRVEVIGLQTVESPLAEGIENIGFDYGFDTNNDGVADEWFGLNGGATAATAATAATKGWGNVVAVRVSLVSRNTEPTVGHIDTRSYAIGRNGATDATQAAANDAFKRRAYVSTIKVQTVAGLREKP